MKPLHRHMLCLAVGLFTAVQSTHALGADTFEPEEPVPSAFEVGGLIGGGFFQINVPDDPPGSLTLLYGSAFSGYGLMVGATSTYRIQTLFGLEGDLLFSWSSVTGMAESASARREISFSESALRLTLLAKLNIALPNPIIELGLGPELAWAIGATCTEKATGLVDPDEPPLRVTTTLALVPVAQVGLSIDVGTVKIPLFARFGWNPFYPDTTEERFEGFNGPDDPGAFIVGADWFFVGMAGARFEL